MARLGMRAEADSALTWLMGFRRPPGFEHWAEVVDHDERKPRFIGDMPHTWVGSDFARSVLDMLAYERESDSALVIGAGVPESWLAGDGIAVRGLRTRWGTLSFTLRRQSANPIEFVARVEAGDLRVPPGGIELALPVVVNYGTFHRIVTSCVDGGGDPMVVNGQGIVTLHTLPAEIHWRMDQSLDGKHR